MRRRTWFVALALVAGLTMAACGSDNNDNENDNGDPNPATATPTPGPTEPPDPPTLTPTPDITEPPNPPTLTPTPEPTAPIEEACAIGESELTVIGNPGSDLDTGWTGIAHDNETPSEVSVAVTIDCPDGENCTIDDDSLVGTIFGAPLPLSSGGIPVCVLNLFRAPIQGTYTCTDGCGTTNVLLESQIFLVQDIAKPCPFCTGDDVFNDGIKNGTCDGGPNDGGACDAGADSEDFGITSLDCPPGGSSVGELDINLAPATTGSISVDSSVECVSPFFPGNQCYCPDQIQANGCTDGVCTATTDANGQPAGECQGGPIDGLCDNERFRSCRLSAGDADCEGLFPGSGDCIAKNRPCFTTNISATGSCAPPGDGNEGTLVSFFCVGATRAAAINTTAGLPGPGLVKLKGRSIRTPQ